MCQRYVALNFRPSCLSLSSQGFAQILASNTSFFVIRCTCGFDCRYRSPLNLLVGFTGLGFTGLGFVGLGFVGLGFVGLGFVGLGFV